MKIRRASIEDAPAVSRILQEIIAATGRDRPNDIAFVTSQYIANEASIRCSVATADDGDVLGFQSLVRATAGNKFAVPEGWAIIGTHISPRAHRRGVGGALFAVTIDAAALASIEKIDAYILAANEAGLRYYDSLGFRTYRASDEVIQKVYCLEQAAPAARR